MMTFSDWQDSAVVTQNLAQHMRDMIGDDLGMPEEPGIVFNASYPICGPYFGPLYFINILNDGTFRATILGSDYDSKRCVEVSKILYTYAMTGDLPEDV